MGRVKQSISQGTKCGLKEIIQQKKLVDCLSHKCWYYFKLQNIDQYRKMGKLKKQANK